MTTPHKRIWFVRVEGVGDQTASATNQLYRWSSAPAPSWDSDGLYRHCLGAGIDIAAQSIEPRTGKSSSGGMSFSLNVELGDPHSVRSIFGRRVHNSVKNITSDITAANTTILMPITFGSSHNGQVIFINREALKLGTSTGLGVFTGCTRGVLETEAQHHRAGVAMYESIKVLRARRVTLCYYDGDATAYTDEVEVQSYQLWDASQTGLVSYDFECDGFTAVLSDAKLLKDQWVAQASQAPNALGVSSVSLMFIGWRPDFRSIGAGGIRLPETLRSGRSTAKGGNATARGGTPADPATGDTFSVVIEGVVYTAHVMSTTDFGTDGKVTEFAAYVEIDPAYGGIGPNIDASTDFGSLDIREVFVSDPLAPGNNGSGSAQLPLGSGVGNHPLGIWLQVVTSTVSGTNGAYDTGVDFGLHIPVSWIDLDAAEKLIDTDPENYRAERFFVGIETSKAQALEKLRKELLAPVGIQQTESTDGRISFTRITDSDYLTLAVDVGEDQLAMSADVYESFRLAVTLDKLIVQYDRAGDGKTRKIPMSDGENTDESLGPVDTEDMDGGSFQSRELVVAAGIDYLSRWRSELPALSFATTAETNVRAGDGVNLTCLAVLGYDETTGEPVEGVTDSRVLITSRQLDIESGTIAYSGLHLGIRNIDTANVAPALKISGANTGTSVPVSASFFVGTDHVRGYTDDIDPWTVGDSAAVLSGDDLSVLESGLTIGSLVSGTVVLTGLTVSVVGGDFIVPDDYGVSTTGQQGSWEYWDEGKQYEG